MKRLILLAAATVLLLFGAACSDDDDGDTVRIGALLPLSGALQSYGEASRAALEHARDAINEDSELKIELVVKDSETSGDAALAALQELDEDGVTVVIGPYASSEVTAVKDYADQNGIILISPLSTAGTLAVPGDNVFRFTPDESKEGEALAAVLADDGITTVVPVHRDDPGNAGLVVGLRAAFGGTVTDPVIYGADETDFTGAIEDIIAALQAAGGSPQETGIFLAAFAEVVDLFEVAASLSNDALRSVQWYGSDSVALLPDLVENADAAGFAMVVGYPNPILGLRDEDESLWGPVLEDLEEELDRRPDTFALAAYDALVVAHMALEEAGADADAAEFAQAFVSKAETHVGLTGPTVLNEAGDRASASFDFWSVCQEGDTFTWKRTISYAVDAAGTGTVNRTGC